MQGHWAGTGQVVVVVGAGVKEHQGLKKIPSGQGAVQPLSAHPQEQEILLLGQLTLFRICYLEFPPWVLALPAETHTMLAPWPCWPPYTN